MFATEALTARTPSPLPIICMKERKWNRTMGSSSSANPKSKMTNRIRSWPSTSAKPKTQNPKPKTRNPKTTSPSDFETNPRMERNAAIGSGQGRRVSGKKRKVVP